MLRKVCEKICVGKKIKEVCTEVWQGILLGVDDVLYGFPEAKYPCR